MPKPTVLVVEDEPLVRELILVEFEDAGFDVLQALDGEQAEALLESGERIDLLFTDLRLPGVIDGWDVALTARRLRPEIPVIYATGYLQTDPRRVAGSRIIAKPYRVSAIIEAAQELGVASD